MRLSLRNVLNGTPIPYVSRAAQGGMRGVFGRRSDAGAQLSVMGVNATIFSIVNRTSTAVAKETWHLHRTGRPGSICRDCEAEGVELVERHPALTVLGKPNNFYTTQEMFESGQQHIDLTGEGWLVMSRIGQMPAELWVARPDRMIVVTDRADFLVGYIYVDPDGMEIPLRKEDVLSMRMPNPRDPYRGMGPVQTVLANVDATLYSAEYNTSFYRNGARPGGIVKLRSRMSDSDFDQLVERFNYNHKGTANAGRTAFLEDGEWLDVKQMSIKDMDLVATSNLNRDTILLAYGMSKFAVGVVDDVNRATAEASKAWFGETITAPRLDRWKGMLNNDFLPQFPGFGYDLEFVYSNPVPADREADRQDKTAAVDNFVKLVSNGVDPAQAAKLCGLPPMTVQEWTREAVPAA